MFRINRTRYITWSKSCVIKNLSLLCALFTSESRNPDSRSISSGVTRIEGGDASAEADDTEEQKKEKEMKEEQDDEAALAKARSWDDWKDGEDRCDGGSLGRLD